MHLPITILYGTLLVIITLLLACATSLARLRSGILLTDKELPPFLYRLHRAHGNSAEWVAPGIALIAFLELQHADPFFLQWIATLLVVARVAHSLNMILKGRFGPITAGTTYVATFAMAAWALILRLR